MSDLVWTENTKPDRPGIWMRKDMLNPLWIDNPKQPYDVGTWSFICDMPVIADAPKYREVNQGDVGRKIEASDREGCWIETYLIAILPRPQRSRFITTSSLSNPDFGWYKHARILDTGPVKQREVWIASHRNGKLCSVHGPTKEEAERDFGGDWKAVKFLEVIDDACGSAKV